MDPTRVSESNTVSIVLGQKKFAIFSLCVAVIITFILLGREILQHVPDLLAIAYGIAILVAIASLAIWLVFNLPEK